MSIFGIGTDMVLVERIERMLEKHAQSFPKRILTEQELSIFDRHPNQAHYLAKRFAAKEAISKALGTGIGDVCSFQDVSILNDEKGAPIVKTSETLGAYLATNQLDKIHISLSDEKEHALAFAIITHG